MKKYEKPSADKLHDRLSVLGQLANIHSIQILHYLHQAKMAFNITISRALGISPQLSVKRLKMLVNAGLVIKERVAKKRVYFFNHTRFVELGLSADLLLK